MNLFINTKYVWKNGFNKTKSGVMVNPRLFYLLLDYVRYIINVDISHLVTSVVYRFYSDEMSCPSQNYVSFLNRIENMITSIKYTTGVCYG